MNTQPLTDALKALGGPWPSPKGLRKRLVLEGRNLREEIAKLRTLRMEKLCKSNGAARHFTKSACGAVPLVRPFGQADRTERTREGIPLARGC